MNAPYPASAAPSSKMSPSRWLWQPRLSSAPRLRLFCLPYAGGAASLYKDWFALVPNEVDLCPVQLPGREGRFAEALLDDPAALLDALHEALAPWLDRPFVLLGYSMGGLIAHGLACRLRPTERARLQRLVVASCSSPEHPAQIDPDRVDRATLLAYIRDLGGTPQAVFEHEELMELMLPRLIADFRLVARLRASATSPAAAPSALLDCPITALGADADSHAGPAQVARWAGRTRGAQHQVSIPGGHFALWQQPHLLIEAALAP